MTSSFRVRPDDRVFVLTGAGVSAESGIPTFRDLGGLWDQYRFEEVASPEAWARDPSLVWRFYSERRRRAAPCKPNAAHLAIAALEASLGDRMFLCTQNVDSLHEQAGSTRIAHVHGELFKTRCESEGCSSAPFADQGTYDGADLPRCKTCDAGLRPHIVWFGETLMAMDLIEPQLSSCTLFVAIGTSGAVWPVSGFVQRLRARTPAPKTIYVGPEAPDNMRWFDAYVEGKAAQVMPGLFQVSE